MFEALSDHLAKAARCLSPETCLRIAELLSQLEDVRLHKRCVFVCGNGGSAANALHWANDFIYGAGKSGRGGLRCHALPANPSVVTCLANDLSYKQIFSAQLEVLASPGDILIVLSGSGNSPNILTAIETARSLGMISWAIVGFDGGKALSLADHSIHLQIPDMQVAEDMQMVICHVLTARLAEGSR